MPNKQSQTCLCRINKARRAFNTLRPIWRSTALSLRKKIRIFNTSVKSVLLYSSETWRVTKTNTHKLQTFTNRCLRNTLNIRWPGVVSNKQLWDKMKQTPTETEIRKLKRGWIGHTLQKPASNITRQALDWNPQGKHKVSHPKQTWRRSTDAEIKAAGTTWAELKRTSQNRVRWRGAVAALCSTRNQEAYVKEVTWGSEEVWTRDASSCRTASPTHYWQSYSGPTYQGLGHIRTNLTQNGEPPRHSRERRRRRRKKSPWCDLTRDIGGKWGEEGRGRRGCRCVEGGGGGEQFPSLQHGGGRGRGVVGVWEEEGRQFSNLQHGGGRGRGVVGVWEEEGRQFSSLQHGGGRGRGVVGVCGGGGWGRGGGGGGNP